MPRVPRPQQPAARRLARSHVTTATASSSGIVVRAAAVLGRVWLGDALIYVVLPLHAGAFGISLALVGVVLSVSKNVSR
jgi:hypothetical protein